MYLWWKSVGAVIQRGSVNTIYNRNKTPPTYGCKVDLLYTGNNYDIISHSTWRCSYLTWFFDTDFLCQQHQNNFPWRKPLELSGRIIAHDVTMAKLMPIGAIDDPNHPSPEVHIWSLEVYQTSESTYYFN